MFLLMGPTSHLHVQNLSYFSYFSELHHSCWFAPIIETMVLLILFLVSVVGNLGALILVIQERRLANTILTVNLFLADLLFVSTVPFVIAVRWTKAWKLGSAACHLIMYFISVSGIVTITTLAAISIERLLAILKMETTPSLNPKWTHGVLLLIWFFSAVAMLPLSLFSRLIPVISPQQVMTVAFVFVFFILSYQGLRVHYSSLSLFTGRNAYMRSYMATFNGRDCVVCCLPCIRLPGTGF
ncbi:free fatty acid receptor 4 [Pangasianodon hypophthalmus]|uniref:free fatty acid receptor 4 n=1 Tax=Pangasianodon hypophthalmus TaxID=310915 RepID=UPI00230795E9|nr:free fatty acid receptor 4 [Pangasianodon hypophthalmus]